MPVSVFTVNKELSSTKTGGCYRCDSTPQQLSMDYANRLPHEEGGASKFRIRGDPRFNIPVVLAQRQKLRESQRLKTSRQI